MWNAAGASLAIAMYLNCSGDHKEYSYEGCSVGVYEYGLQFGNKPILYWNDLKEEDLNKCVTPMLHCGSCEIILVHELLRDMGEWPEVKSVTHIRDEGNVSVLGFFVGNVVHYVIAYPCDSPVLFVTDAVISKLITHRTGSWFVRDRIGIDSAGRAMRVASNDPGTYVVFRDNISIGRVIDFINDGKPDDESGIIGDIMYDGIKSIIQSNTNWIERYNTLVSILRSFDSDLPDMLNVALCANEQNKEV